MTFIIVYILMVYVTSFAFYRGSMPHPKDGDKVASVVIGIALGIIWPLALIGWTTYWSAEKFGIKSEE